MSFKREQEVVAALVVEATTDLSLRDLDPGGGARQLADFATVNRDGIVVGVVEVTTTTVEQRIRFSSAVAGQDWEFPDLAWFWSVRAIDTYDARGLRQGIGPLLADLEQAARTDGWIPDRPNLSEGDPDALPGGLAALGVVSVCAVFNLGNEGKPGWVSVLPVIRGGAYSLDAVTWAVETELWKADNRAKTFGEGEGQLFVWLDVSDAQAALTTLVSPPFDQRLASMSTPRLPKGVTMVWAASGLADWPRPVTAILRCQGDQWEVVAPPLFA
jgi:hypothetical protein